jgi:hypothetical protein
VTGPGTVRTVILAIVGLGLAVAVGFAANAISRDSIGLAPTPLGSGVRLAPPKTTSTPARPTRTAPSTAKKKATRPKPKPSTTPTAPPPAASTPPTTTTTSGGDDNGGDRGGGDDNSGSGSSGSGSGNSGRGGGDDD